MESTAANVKKLRDATGAGFNDCKEALAASSTFEAAVKYIEEKGKKQADKVKGQDRETLQGAIFHYIHHGNNLGVLLELNCTTDFVARSEDFKTLGKELAVHIAGMNPEFIAFTDIPAQIVEEARAQIAADPEVQKRPERVRDQVIEGKLKKQFGTRVLLEQPWVKDENKTIAQLIDDVIRTTKENIVVRRFARFVLGEPLGNEAPKAEAETEAAPATNGHAHAAAPAEAKAEAKAEPAAEKPKKATKAETTTKASSGAKSGSKKAK